MPEAAEQSTISFDAETEAHHEDKLRPIFDGQWKPPKPPEKKKVVVKKQKYGNIQRTTKYKEASKDEQTTMRRAKDDEDQLKLDAEYEAAMDDLAGKKEEEFQKFCEQAALSPVTGRVLCIFYYSLEKDKYMVDGILSEEPDESIEQEKMILRRFWTKVEQIVASTNGASLVGLNIDEFDLPFFARRSWILGEAMPQGIIDYRGFWHQAFIDVRKRWLLGSRGGSGIANKSDFNWLGSAFGTGGKPEGVSGKDFAKSWWSDRKAAKAYGFNDVKKPMDWALRMGLV